MKNQLKNTIILAVVFTASLFQSCKKDNNNNPGGSTGQKILTMKVNGVDWVANDDLFGYTFTSNNFVNISGKKTASNEFLTIGNFEVPNVGTYIIAPTVFNGIAYTKGGTTPKSYKVLVSIPSSKATLIVTKINTGTSITNNIEGTFSAVLYASPTDSVVITNGVFKFN